ncbi:22822_t:CDS:2 [Gigaspora margarita]|uniref:22822_t:CDS:1 n=1 Tax=Gigaspora margarita TaxID=4874 RepID=A0ABN7ULY3_GIGMA|nr:22822_t:CDS:2 [Gigaspora margarita]
MALKGNVEANANNPEYSQFMDNIGDGIDGKNVFLPLLSTIHELDKAIDFIFPTHLLDNLIICLWRAILSPLNKEVNSLNNTILQHLNRKTINLIVLTIWQTVITTVLQIKIKLFEEI